MKAVRVYIKGIRTRGMGKERKGKIKTVQGEEIKSDI